MGNQTYPDNQRPCRGRNNWYRWSYVTAVILLCSMACSGIVIAHEPEDDQRAIILLHTNDLHFNIKHAGTMQDKISRFRDQYADVFLFDAGDFTIRPTRWAQRNIVSNADAYEKRMQIMVRNMNELGYHAAVLGNHELGYYKTVTRDLLRQADFPFLGANVMVSTDYFDEPKAYLVFKADGGMRLAVLGLCGGGFDNAEGIRLANVSDTVYNHRKLHDESHAFVLLTHIGVQKDRMLADEYGDLIDVIIGGHSHTLLNPPEMRNGVLIAQAGHGYNEREYLGVIRLIFDDEKNLIEKQGEVLIFKHETHTTSRFLHVEAPEIQLQQDHAGDKE